jgi:hypothetical protein
VDGSAPIGCLGPRPDLAAILALDASQRLSCFGRSALTFQAIVVAAEAECGPVQVAPAWLWCPPIAFLTAPPMAASWPAPENGASADGPAHTKGGLTLASLCCEMLGIHAAPGSGLDRALATPGAIVQVIGHFDDQAALACRVVGVQEAGFQVPTPAEVVLACREAFVVSAVVPGSA